MLQEGQCSSSMPLTLALSFTVEKTRVTVPLGSAVVVNCLTMALFLVSSEMGMESAVGVRGRIPRRGERLTRSSPRRCAPTLPSEGRVGEKGSD